MTMLLIEVSKIIRGSTGQVSEVEYMTKCFGFEDNTGIERTIERSRVGGKGFGFEDNTEIDRTIERSQVDQWFRVRS